MSSTHIAIGAVFGIGFLREFRRNANPVTDTGVSNHLRRVLYRIINSKPAPVTTNSTRKPRRLVRRRRLLTIVAAWFITVPSAAVIAAAFFKIAHYIAG